ncbi:hypothetical protein ATANTOWER_019660 [Ataeniobius toweri]|uniref:Uncharacterized protein n=1 Tax=Ataeniobius toweri TaxID=208326 RepID=A0ABU7C8H0_9TELE|nr:hypothetical protein [Ataeniobius toweri]
MSLNQKRNGRFLPFGHKILRNQGVNIQASVCGFKTHWKRGLPLNKKCSCSDEARGSSVLSTSDLSRPGREEDPGNKNKRSTLMVYVQYSQGCLGDPHLMWSLSPPVG